MRRYPRLTMQGLMHEYYIHQYRIQKGSRPNMMQLCLSAYLARIDNPFIYMAGMRNGPGTCTPNPLFYCMWIWLQLPQVTSLTSA